MVTKRISPKTRTIPGTARGASGVPKNPAELTKLARSLLANKSVPPSALESDVACLSLLLTDQPELLDSLGAPPTAAKKEFAKPLTGAYSPEQLVSMARHHFAAKAGSASADHSSREIDRFLSEHGMY